MSVSLSFLFILYRHKHNKWQGQQYLENSPRLFVDPSMSESNTPYRSRKYWFLLEYPIGRNAMHISIYAVNSIARSLRDPHTHQHTRGGATEDCRSCCNCEITNPGNEQRVYLSHEASARSHGLDLLQEPRPCKVDWEREISNLSSSNCSTRNWNKSRYFVSVHFPLPNPGWRKRKNITLTATYVVFIQYRSAI